MGALDILLQLELKERPVVTKPSRIPVGGWMVMSSVLALIQLSRVMDARCYHRNAYNALKHMFDTKF